MTTFTAAFPQRARALSASYPAIATASGTFVGAGLTIMMYGFTPGAQITLSITGASNNVPSVRTVDQYGVSSIYLDSAWPQGTYTISVTWSGGTVTTSATKTASIADMLPPETGQTGPLELRDVPPGFGR